jgi:hypothetical protein
MSGDHEKESAPRRETEGAQENCGDSVPSENSPIIPVADSGGNGGALLGFLRGWSPDGPWWPTAIPREGGGTETRTFTSLDALAAWAAGLTGVKNLYFHVNDLSPDTREKASKDEVTRVRGLHVDVDPRAVEGGAKGKTREALAAHFEAERARIWAMFDDWEVDGQKLPFPRPTAVIDSGGGFQGFWLFAEGEEVAPDLAERLNAMISAAMGGDKTYDVSRIMRLPGTVNLANKKKRDNGRGDAPTRLALADWTRRFRVRDFPAPAPATSVGAPAPVGRVAVTAAPAVGLDLDTLPPGVTDRIKAMIVQGEDVNDPGRYPSRSEAYWAVICAMARAKCTDAQMMGVSLDPDLKISGHVLDQPRSEGYASDQVAKAKEEAAGDPQLTDMNARHAFLSHEGGKVRVCEFAYELEDPNETRPERQRRRWVTYLQSAADFKATHNNRSAVVGKDKEGHEVKKPLGDTWLGWEHRRQHRALTFNPSAGELVGDKLNLWRGFPVRPKPGDWGLFKAHILHVMAAGDPEVAGYITRWLALAVQRPAEPAGVALVFKGGRGSGKGLFAHIARDLFGQHSYYLPGAAALTGKFNAHFRDTVLVYADEVKWNGNKNAESLLQAMITERELLIEGKYKDTVLSRNCLHLIMTSNDDWVVPAAIDERRFAVFRTDDSKRGNKAYFRAIAEQMKGDGLAAMLHDLMAMDLSGWDAMVNMPASPELTQQKLEGLSGPNRLVWEMLMQGCAPGGRFPTVKVGKDDHRHSNPAVELADVIAWGIKQNLIRDAVSSQRMSDAVKRLGITRTQPYLEGRQQWAWVLPPLAEARAAWAESLGLVGIEWPEGTEWLAFNPEA